MPYARHRHAGLRPDFQTVRAGDDLIFDPRTAEEQVNEDLGLAGKGLIRRIVAKRCT